MANTAVQIEVRDSAQANQTFLPVGAGLKYDSARWQGASVAGDASIAVSDFGATVRNFSVEVPICELTDWQNLWDFVELAAVNYQQNWFYLSMPEYESNAYFFRGVSTTTISGRDFVKVRLAKPNLIEQTENVWEKTFPIKLRLEETT